jgi:hypothetical protein
MPATRSLSALESPAALKVISQLYALRLKQVRDLKLPRLDAKEVARTGLTMRGLFRRVGMQTADIAGAIPMADSTLRGIVSGRTQPSLPLPLMNRLLTLLDVDWSTFVAAYEQTMAGRAPDETKANPAA